VDIETVVARAEVNDVLARYVHAADRGDWELLRSCYHDDAYDDHGEFKGGPDGLVDHVRAVAGLFLFTMHQLGQMLIEVNPTYDAARAETYCLGWYGRQSSGSECLWTIAQGLRYLDEFEKRDGRGGKSLPGHSPAATGCLVARWSRIRGSVDDALSQLSRSMIMAMP
jgi:hypothetical protein